MWMMISSLLSLFQLRSLFKCLHVHELLSLVMHKAHQLWAYCTNIWLEYLEKLVISRWWAWSDCIRHNHLHWQCVHFCHVSCQSKISFDSVNPNWLCSISTFSKDKHVITSFDFRCLSFCECSVILLHQRKMVFLKFKRGLSILVKVESDCLADALLLLMLVDQDYFIGKRLATSYVKGENVVSNLNFLDEDPFKLTSLLILSVHILTILEASYHLPYF